MKKARYKEIFIFIAGSTPQVITETIYALAMQKPPVHPNEIYIITTCRGREIAENTLIKKDILNQLCDEYNFPQILLKDNSFIIPSGCAGNRLDDIRDKDENEAMGDLITSFIREKTVDPAARLHCSIAGGRKTMSFYMGAAMQLFGRPWDKLYHVLVTPEFESNPEFFYKPKKQKIIKCHDKKLNTDNARIILAELPFIRLRDKLSIDGAGFKELVAEGQKEIDTVLVQPQLTVKLSQCAVQIGRKTIKLTPQHLVIYTAYLKSKLYRCKHPERQYCKDCTDCFPSLLEITTKASVEEMAKDMMLISPSKAEDFMHKYREGAGQDVIRQAISKIKKMITEELNNEALASCYAITTAFRIYNNTRHGIRAEKGKIRIE
ncbi:MAG: TIGR02584 family CRISPR-associated protein [Nitrospirae bacterium]|nr:TIGR02584 family CRISPR-associated protein [Nitrospirota bacterium]